RDEASVRQADRDHARARTGTGGDARRPPRPPLSALSPRRRALHAAHARRPAVGFSPHPGAPRPRARSAGAGSRAAGRRACRAARPVLDVVPNEVVQPCGRWLFAEGAVWAFVVVSLEEARERG